MIIQTEEEERKVRPQVLRAQEIDIFLGAQEINCYFFITEEPGSSGNGSFLHPEPWELMKMLCLAKRTW